MHSRRFFSVCHIVTSYRLLFALLAFLVPCTTFGQKPGRPIVVALDHSTADLLRAFFPAIECRVVIQFENELNTAVNKRAWSTRDADVLVFRSDQMSFRSQLFRERLMTQGIRAVDLTAHISIKRALPFRLDADGPKFLQSNVARSIATHLPVSSGQVIGSPTDTTASIFQNRSLALHDLHSPNAACPPCKTETECQRQILAKVSTKHSND